MCRFPLALPHCEPTQQPGARSVGEADPWPAACSERHAGEPPGDSVRPVEAAAQLASPATATDILQFLSNSSHKIEMFVVSVLFGVTKF